MQHQSEVARLRAQIVAEYEAGIQGLSGLAEGTARHQFITKKLETMQRCQKELIALVGQEKANAIIAEAGL